MNIVRVLGFILFALSPCSFAGLMKVDMENFSYWDDDGFLQQGGRLSLQVETGGLDSHPDNEKGFYEGAILKGSFFNAYSGREYQFDITGANSVFIDLSSSFYTAITLCGVLADIDGNKADFDLRLEGTYKDDDHLEDLVDKVYFFKNEVTFFMSGPSDSFVGHAPNIATFSKDVPEPSHAMLLLIGIAGLGMLRFKRLQKISR